MRSRSRARRGNATVELPVALLVFLLLALFPMIDLATIFLGSNSIVSAARLAAVEAARAQTFTTDVSPTKLSAINTARKVASGFSTGGVTIDSSSVKVQALQTPIEGGPSQTITPSPQLNVNPTKYIYQIKVTITGQVKPLIMLNSDFLGKIQGLTEPIVVTTSSTANFENSNGLNG